MAALPAAERLIHGRTPIRLDTLREEHRGNHGESCDLTARAAMEGIENRNCPALAHDSADRFARACRSALLESTDSAAVVWRRIPLASLLSRHGGSTAGLFHFSRLTPLGKGTRCASPLPGAAFADPGARGEADAKLVAAPPRET